MIRFLKRLAGDVTTPAAGKVTLFVDTAGAVKTKDESGTVASVGGGGSGTTVTIANSTRTSGDIAMNSTSWADLDNTLDLTVTAAAGDLVEVGISAYVGAGSSVEAYLDVVTVVSGSPVNHVSGAGGSTGRGIVSWTGGLGQSVFVGPWFPYTVQAGDVSAGSVIFRLRYRTNTATNKPLLNHADYPLNFWVKNYGQ